MSQSIYTKFFTNEDTNTLFERFKDTLKEAQFFDMLVGYFRISGFNRLWEESVPISDEFVNEATDKTWLNDKITPYLLSLKFLYEYFEEDINTDKQIEIHLPKNFIELEYQKQAVNQANRILHTYNGIMLADVVGLGKTFITSMLLQQIEGKKLVICPPRLNEYW